MMMNVCGAFQKNADGSWTSLEGVTLNAPGGDVQIAPVMTFVPGEPFMGLDIGTWLEQNCAGDSWIPNRFPDKH